MDPVGKYGKGPAYVYKHLLKNEVRNLELKLYPEARHELFNETESCRGEVFSDIVSFLEKLKK
jgi:alpha-beta hydrolase superfamily lysophospholipase